MLPRFKDRADAGRQLGLALAQFAGEHTIVLGLPRGGVEVAAAAAYVLRAPLDVLNVRKLGVPWQPELGIGAIAAGGVRVLNTDVIMAANVTKEDLEEETALQTIELGRREQAYREGRKAPTLRDRVVILIDDGMVTGATMRAAVAVVRAKHPAKIVVAVPVSQDAAAAAVTSEVDEFVCLRRPGDLTALSLWYEHFPPLADDDVRRIVAAAESDAIAELVEAQDDRVGALDGDDDAGHRPLS